MHFDTATRQRWMRALAYSNADALNARINALKLTPDYELIRAPESGLMQIQPVWAVLVTASLPVTPRLPALWYA